MRKIEDVLRLKWSAGLSARQIGKAVGIGRTTVSEYIARAEAAGITWPLPVGMDAAQLERRLFKAAGGQRKQERAQPDFATIHRELRGKGVTLFLLWQEYRERHPDGYAYSRFCDHYARWQGHLDVVMRQSHRAGEKLFVDYAGQTAQVGDRTTGEIREAQIFVAVLGASNYTYAEATWTQGLSDWIGSHVRTLAFLGGVPEVIVPDNLKSAVSKAHRYEPDLNPTYQPANFKNERNAAKRALRLRTQLWRCCSRW
jgi:transposase